MKKLPHDLTQVLSLNAFVLLKRGSADLIVVQVFSVATVPLLILNCFFVLHCRFDMNVKITFKL